MDIRGVPIFTGSKRELSGFIGAALCGASFRRIATVNPEFLVRAARDHRFADNLRQADLCLADGFGIVLAGLVRGERISRVPGVDVVDALLRVANGRRLSVFLAVRADGLSSFEEIRRAISEKYPHLVLDGEDIPESLFGSAPPKAENRTIVLCNFGAPDQEYFCEALRAKPGAVRLAVGIGGAFDFLTGKRKRAPRWLRAIGLEWLWRLLIQPRRWRRIRDAVIVFPWLVVKDIFMRKEKGRLC